MALDHYRDLFENRNGWIHGITSRYGYDIRRRHTDYGEDGRSTRNVMGRVLLKRTLLAAIVGGLAIMVALSVYCLFS